MREGTREDLLEAAKRQFAEKGFHAASISQMAGEPSFMILHITGFVRPSGFFSGAR
jgi:hypothetical protein